MKKPIELDTLTEVNTEELYENMLDEAFGNVTIAGLTYATSCAQRGLDPTAYRCGLLDYIDSLEQDEQIVSFDNGETYYYVDQVQELLDNEGKE